MLMISTHVWKVEKAKEVGWFFNDRPEARIIVAIEEKWQFYYFMVESLEADEGSWLAVAFLEGICWKERIH